MRRFDGFLTFDRDWGSYYEGFGDLSGEFWLGLKNMRQSSGDVKFDLRFELEAPDGSKANAEYTNCTIETWVSKFRLTMGPFVGRSSKTEFIYN